MRASNSSCTKSAMKKILTVDQALAILTEAKKQMGGEAALILSLTDSGIPDADVNDMVIQYDKDNAYVEVQVSHPYLEDAE